MRMSSRNPRSAAFARTIAREDFRGRVDLVMPFLLACVLALISFATVSARSGSATAAGSDSVLSADQRRSLDRQLAAPKTPEAPEAPDTSGSSDLWEEYQKYRDRDRSDLEPSGERVKVGDSVEVLAGELVQGDVVSIGGDVDVKGVVDGDVVAVGGNVILHEGAEVSGDAVAVGGRVKEIGHAIVRGEKVSVNVPIPLFGLRDHELGMPRFMRLFLGWKLGFLAVGLVLCLLFNAVAGQRLDVVSRRVEAEPGQSFLIGLLGAFGTPIAMLISFLLLAITVIGLLLFPVLLILVWLVMLGGFAAVAIAVGRRMAQGGDLGGLPPSNSSYRNLTVGFLVLQGFLIVGMILTALASWGPIRPIGVLLGVLGVFVVIFASIVGFGAALLSRLGTQAPGLPAWSGTAGGPPPSFAGMAAPPGGGFTPPPPPPPPGGFTPPPPPPTSAGPGAGGPGSG